MDRQIYETHEGTILHLINNLGEDNTDEHLKQELLYAAKTVETIKEQISVMKNSLINQTNHDAILRLKYNIEDSTILLNNLMHKLQTADEKYLCFREYIRRKNRDSFLNSKQPSIRQ
ncbi:MAG: hypothetical protein ACOYVK_06210 [Bacillota bacterium]